MSPPRRKSILSRACDGCRSRKVKCSGTQPCSACQAGEIECLYQSARKRRGPRVLRATDGEPMTNQPLQDPTVIDSALLGSPARSAEYGVLDTRLGDSPETSFSYDLGRDILADRIKPGIATTIRRNFLVAVPGAPEILDHCIRLYMRFVFPLAPIVHEASLRASAHLVFSDNAPPVVLQSGDQYQCLSWMRKFAVMTGLCASVASVVPPTLLPFREQILQPALHASRDMLAAYEDYDLEYPNSSSLIVRLFQSTALQHATGRSSIAWHIYGQAALLAHRMRLYAEESLPRDDPTENTILRYLFWHMNLCDTSASVLSNRAALLRAPYLSGPVTLETSLEHGSVQLTCFEPTIEEQILSGYHLGRRVWDRAADIIDIMRASKDSGLINHEELTQTYLEFTGMLDNHPTLSTTASIPQTVSDPVSPRFCFHLQECSIALRFACLRLLIFQEAIECNLTKILGYSNHAVTLLLRKIEIVNDILGVLNRYPLHLVRLLGEPMVEVLRRVGSILLEVLQCTDNHTIRSRAQVYFTSFIDVLAQLGSKASENLVSQ